MIYDPLYKKYIANFRQKGIGMIKLVKMLFNDNLKFWKF